MLRLSLLLLACLFGAGAAQAQMLDPGQRAQLAALRSGDMRKLVIRELPMPAPDAVFTDASGAEHRLADSNGKVRLVNFWATWCAPCRAESPSLDALAGARAGADFAVLPIATGRNTQDAIAAFESETGITHLASFLDPQSTLARAMDVPGLPVTVVLNREGDEIARLLGSADWNGDSARAIIDYLTALPG
ncbi:MAG: TlpA disulfide reductase family protein [Amaricoccus sp.]